MCAKWNDKKYDPEIIIRRLNRQRVSGDGQRVTWHGLIDDLEEILLSAVELCHDLTEFEKLNVVRTSVQDVAKASPLSSELLLRAIKENERKRLQKPVEPFVVVSSWSTRVAKTVRRLPGGTVTVNARVTRSLRSQRDDGISKVKPHFACKLPDDYADVKVRVRARDADAAYRRGQDALDLLRGIWNWHLNRRIAMRLSWGRKTPVNQIQPGPIHTVHILNRGNPVETWYEPTFVGPVRIKSLAGNELTKLRRFEQNLKRELRASRYRSWIDKAIQRYAQAFDPIDFESAFLRAWSLLEYLTASEGRYDELVRRASFVWKDLEFHRQALTHLREHRNNIAHNAVGSAQRDAHLVQVKTYVEALMCFHVRSSRKLKRHETLELLDGPRTVGAIARRQKLLRIAAQMRGTQ